MSEPLPRPSNDDLQSLLDGQVDARWGVRLLAAVNDDPELAARYAQLKADRDALREALAPMADEPIPQRLRVATIRAKLRRRLLVRSAAALAACLFLLAGGAAGYWLRASAPQEIAASDPAARWKAVAEEAMRAHKTYSAEVRYPVEIRGDGDGQLSAVIARRLGRRLPPPDLKALGFALVGGRILPSAYGTAALVMYENAAGDRLSVYLKPGETGETAMRSAAAGTEQSVYWVDDGCAYVIAGSLGKETMQAVANAVFAHFETAAPG